VRVSLGVVSVDAKCAYDHARQVGVYSVGVSVVYV